MYNLQASIASSVKTFLDARCITGEWQSVTSTALYTAYCSWCADQKIPAQSQRMLGAHLSKNGYSSSPMYRDGKTQRCWSGIALKDQ